MHACSSHKTTPVLHMQMFQHVLLLHDSGMHAGMHTTHARHTCKHPCQHAHTRTLSTGVPDYAPPPTPSHQVCFFAHSPEELRKVDSAIPFCPVPDPGTLLPPSDHSPLSTPRGQTQPMTHHVLLTSPGTTRMQITPAHQPPAVLQLPQQQLPSSCLSGSAGGNSDSWSSVSDGVLYRIPSVDTCTTVSHSSLYDSSMGSNFTIAGATSATGGGQGAMQDADVLQLLLLEAELNRQASDAATAARCAARASEMASRATAFASSAYGHAVQVVVNDGGMVPMGAIGGVDGASPAQSGPLTLLQLPPAQLQAAQAPSVEATIFTPVNGAGAPVTFASFPPGARVLVQGPSPAAQHVVLQAPPGMHGQAQPLQVTAFPSSYLGEYISWV